MPRFRLTLRTGCLEVWRAARRIAAALILAGLVAACGAATSPRLVTPEHPLSPGGFSFLAYAGTLPSEQHALVDAEALLKTRCMAADGFAFYGGAPGPPAGSTATRLYTYGGQPPAEKTNLETRQRLGYGLSALYSPAGQRAASGGRGVEFNQTYVHSLGRAVQSRYFAALGGKPDIPQGVVRFHTMVITYSRTGCQASADKTLYGSARADLTATAIGEYAFALVSKEAAGDTSASAARWSACVYRATGKRFANPNVAVQYVQMRYQRYGDTQAARSYERTLATRDGRCEYQSGLAQEYAATFRRLAGALPTGVIRALAWADALDRAAVRRALSILSKAGPRGRRSLSPPAGEASNAVSTTPIAIGRPSQQRQRFHAIPGHPHAG